MKTNKQEILIAALKLFFKKGYEATTTAEIAKAVGLCHSGLFNHFSSKEELFQKAVEAFFLKVHDPRIKFRKSEGTFLDFIDNFIEGVSSTMSSMQSLSNEGNSDVVNSADYFMFIFTVIKKYDKYIRDYAEVDKMLVSLWMEQLEKAKASGEIKENLDSDLIAKMFHYTYYGDSCLSAIIKGGLEPAELKKTFYGYYNLIKE